MTRKKIENFYYIVLFVSLCFIFIFPRGLRGATSAAQTPPEINNLTESQYANAEKKANAIRQKIQELVKAKKFKEAENLFDEISKIYSSLGNTKYVTLKLSTLQSEKNIFLKKWSDYIEDQATNAYLNKNYDKSIALSKQSMKILNKISLGTPDTYKQEQIISKSSAVLNNEAFNKKIAINNVLPEYKYRVKDLDDALTKAQVFMDQKEYKKAKDCLEEALLLDPYNYKAMNMLNTLYTNLLDIAKARSQAEELQAVAQVQWLNNQPISPNITEKGTLVVRESKTEQRSKLKEKLDNIILNKIDFDKASLSSVITYLNRESKILDTSNDHSGINIILKLKHSQLEPKTVTLQLDNIPIGEVIKYVCRYTNLKYRVEDDAVIIGDDSIEQMETRFFHINSGLINSIVSNIIPINTSITSGGAKNFYNSKKFAQDIDIGQQNVTTAQLINYFKERGIPFPQGSTIAWDNKTSTLIATNTTENLQIMDNLIKEIDVQIPLVLIETKFVEITETELEELSFKWKFSMTGSKVDINKFTGPSQTGNDALVRPYDNGDIGKLINDLSYSSSNGIGGETNINFWMYALDRSKTAEVLSSPKLTTKSGSKAVIKMVTENYYPQSWSTPSVSINGNAPIINYSSPTFGDPTDLGITLEVTPTVSPNNYTILLDLYPQVVDFAGWTSYQYKITTSTPSDTSVITVPAKMAQISRRDVRTRVKIYDGETVVLGGTIKEEGVYLDDIVPIFGDIPLAGRLFRSKYKDVERVNLLVFVTARLVSPDGTPIHKRSNGLFDFGR